MKELIWNDLIKYPILSAELKSSLDLVKCPEDISELFDRALWCQLYKKPFSMEFTIYEAFVLDSWTQSMKTPKGFNKILKKGLDDQLGIKFSDNSIVS